jgi:hypothetical protein
MIISKLESVDVVDIGASFKYCVALLDDGYMRQWGCMLLEKSDGLTREQVIDMKV